MIKKIIALILFVSINVFAGDCGKVTKLSFSPDHGGLVGLSMRLDDTKVRVTINNSPDLIGHVQATIDKRGYKEDYGLFICLDDYSTLEKPYRGRVRVYIFANEYRIYENGNLLIKK